MSTTTNNFWENFHKHLDREKNGVWVSLFGSKFKVKLHIATNSDFSDLLQKDKELARITDSERSDYSQKRLVSELMGKFVVCDWQSFQCPDSGKDIEFTREKCLEIMRKFPDLAARIERAASIEESNYLDGLESTKKN